MFATYNNREVFLIDDSVAKEQSLLGGLPAEALVYVLNGERSGLAQMAEVLHGCSGINAIHLISHGSAGAINLSGGDITAAALVDDVNASALETIRNSLSDNADFFIYGCNVAEGQLGQRFIQALAQATNTDVCASTNATGSSALGGDWELEASTGIVTANSIRIPEFSGLLAAPTINGLDPTITYAEGGSPILIDNNIVFSNGSNFGGGFVRYSIENSNSADQLVLANSGTPNGNGEISISNGVVFLGNGSGTEQIGVIDAVENGVNGQPLKINFTANFTNPGFETGGGTVTGWTIGEQQVKLGATVIAGYTTPSDSSLPNPIGSNQTTPSRTTFDSQVATEGSNSPGGGGTGGSASLRLFSSMTTTNGFDVVNGPYAESNTFESTAGDELFFDWKAAGGSDAYDAFGYLLNVDTGATNIVINQTGASASASTSWATLSVTVPTTGNYKFVFISGTWDATGGKAAGGSLFVDNFKVFNDTVNNEIAQSIVQQVTYENTSPDTPTSRELTVSAADVSGVASSATSDLVITQANNAPTFTSNGSLPAVAEDTVNPSGASVISFMGSIFSDPDATFTPADTLAGIAVVADGGSASEGAWEYSTDGGSTWHAIGTVSTSSALLLSSASLVRFVSIAEYSGTPGALSVHAVDSSGGLTFTDGLTRESFDTTIDGGSSAVSASAFALGTTITPINDAPVLADGAPILTTHTEDEINNAGNLISDLVGGATGGDNPGDKTGGTDIDTLNNGGAGNAPEGVGQGIAIFATTNDGPADGGSWEYSINNGVSWQAVGTVDTANALLLSSTDKIRFVPDQENATTATINYYLWDGASGIHGSKVDATTRGNSTAFSTLDDTASIAITPINDAPKVDLDATAVGSGYSSNFLIQGSGVPIVASDVSVNEVDKTNTETDTIASATIAITAGAADNTFGTINETLIASGGNTSSNGLTVSGSGTPTISITGVGTGADYEALLKTITYHNANPDAFSGVRTITVSMTDSAVVVGTPATSTTTSSINNGWAPVIDANGGADGVVFDTTFTEGDAPLAITTSDSTITDEDSALSQLVVSISNVQNAGLETLIINGGDSNNWNGIAGLTASGSGTDSITLSGNISPNSYQLALRSIQYANDSVNPGEVRRDITIVATDTSGIVGNTGHSHINVVPVPSIPTVATSITDIPATDPGPGTQTFVIPNGTFTDGDGDTFTYTAVQLGGSPQTENPLPEWLTLDPSTGAFSGNPPHGVTSPMTIQVTATDPSGRSVTDTFDWAFVNTNDLPSLSTPLENQNHADSGSITPYTFGVDTFVDEDPGETLTYTAGEWDGSNLNTLPDWLIFNPVTRTFSGNPPAGTASPITIRVSATDSAGETVTDDFDIVLSGNLNDIGNLPGTAQSVRVGVSEPLDDFTITDEAGSTQNFTVNLTTTNGSISGLTDLDNDPTNGIQLSGTAADINAMLASAQFRTTTPGAANIAIEVTDSAAPTPNVTTATYHLFGSNIKPRPTSVQETVDGVLVNTSTSTNGDTTTSTTTVPVITPARPEDPFTEHTDRADIPLVTDNDESILQVSLPNGVGLTSEEMTGTAATLREMLIAASDPKIDDVQVFDEVLQQGIDTYVETVTDENQVTLRTITIDTADDQALDLPIVVTGALGTGEDNLDNPLRQEALVIDTRDTPPETELQFDNIEFAIIIGSGRVVGGEGRNFVIGDDANQFIVLGVDDDVLRGGFGDDTIGSKGGDDQLFGDGDNDHLIGGEGNDMLEGGDGNDLLQGSQSDAGTWTFSLNDQGQVVSTFNVADAALSTTPTLITQPTDWFSGDTPITNDNRVSFVYQDVVLVETVSTLYQSVLQRLPTTDEINFWTQRGLNESALGDVAYQIYLDSQGSSQAEPVETQITQLISQVWGAEHATSDWVNFGIDHINNGGSWSEIVLFMARHNNLKSQILDSNGHLQLTQDLQTSEIGWSSDTGDDTLLGGQGDDVLIGGRGHNLMDGGTGFDSVKMFETAESHHIFITSEGKISISHRGEGVIINDLSDVEQVVFSDQTLDVSASNLDAATLKDMAALIHLIDNAPPTLARLNQLAESNVTTSEFAEAIMSTTTYEQNWGNLSNVNFISQINGAVFDGTMTDDSLTFWVNQLEQNIMDHDDILLVAAGVEDYQESLFAGDGLLVL